MKNVLLQQDLVEQARRSVNETIERIRHDGKALVADVSKRVDETRDAALNQVNRVRSEMLDEGFNKARAVSQQLQPVLGRLVELRGSALFHMGIASLQQVTVLEKNMMEAQLEIQGLRRKVAALKGAQTRAQNASNA